MKNFLKGHDGKLSSMRIASLSVVFTILSVFVAHNVLAMINGESFVSMGASEAMLLAGALGAKAAQHFSEKKNNNYPFEKTQ